MTERDRNAGTSRRNFIRTMGLVPAAALTAWIGCTTETTASASPGGDAGQGQADTSSGFNTDTAQADTPQADIGDETCTLSGSDVEGPFHRDDAPERTQLATLEEPGDRLVITGRVVDLDCQPITGALLDVWHADETGAYHAEDAEYRLRGQMLSDGDGNFSFETIRPGNYPMAGTMRPAHVHFIVTSPRTLPLTTQLYFSDDPYLAPNDPCTGCNSGDPTLIIDLGAAQVAEKTQWSGHFEVVLERA